MTLTSLFWELATHFEWQDKVRTELTSIQDVAIVNMPTWESIKNKAALHAVIQEGLRMHGAVPGSLYREVPKGGRIIDGHFVPQGVISCLRCLS